MFVLLESSSSLSSDEDPTAWIFNAAIGRRAVLLGEAFILPVKKVSSSRKNFSPPSVGDLEGSSSEPLQLLPGEC